jgi:hypothetical protein
MGMDEDVPYGQGIVDAMKPFMKTLIAEGLERDALLALS